MNMILLVTTLDVHIEFVMYMCVCVCVFRCAFICEWANGLCFQSEYDDADESHRDGALMFTKSSENANDFT